MEPLQQYLEVLLPIIGYYYPYFIDEETEAKTFEWLLSL